MVRRNELACRDEWSRSLWQPREGQQANGDMPFQRPALGPLPPTLAENLRSVLNHDMALAASSQGEDVLLSEARIVSEAQEPWEPQHRPFPVGNFDPRTAIFRAREAYRERVRAKASAERQSAGVEAVVEPPTVEDSALASAQESTADADGPVPQEFDPTPAGEMPNKAQDGEPGLSYPDEAGWQEVTPALPAVSEPIESPAHSGPSLVAGEDQLGETVTAWQPVPARDENIGTPAASTWDIQVPDHANRLDEMGEREALPDWYRADLPRICRTCRDYRPSADGQRGWCANTWAFTHRRLVLEDDPAPCQSAIGDWWLPVDDAWLVAADVSSHGRPTPLLDRLTAKAEQQRRRS